MKMVVTKKIGTKTYPFTVEGENLFDLLMESKKLAFYDVYKCGICGGDKLSLDAYVTKDGGYKYAVVRCQCGARLTFGQPKVSPDTYYLRKTEDGKLDWQAGEKKVEKEEEINVDDIPNF